jgi:hypothetical protein
MRAVNYPRRDAKSIRTVLPSSLSPFSSGLGQDATRPESPDRGEPGGGRQRQEARPASDGAACLGRRGFFYIEHSMLLPSSNRSHPLPRCAERWWLNDESLATAGGIKTHCNFAVMLSPSVQVAKHVKSQVMLTSFNPVSRVARYCGRHIQRFGMRRIQRMPPHGTVLLEEKPEKH